MAGDNQSRLFSPFTLREVTFRNRVVVSPMCQYSSEDGFATDWHLVHLGSRAVGGAGLIILEATAIEARGRISPQDLGIYSDRHIPELKRIAAFIKSQGAVPGIQLNHAGRKASTYRPWSGSGAVPVDEGGWQVVGPTNKAFTETYPLPTALSVGEINDLVETWAKCVTRAVEAGFEVIEIHAAHGYLIHQFFSPLSNDRTDRYGGSFEARTRFGNEVVRACRAALPDHLPLLLRISASDWTPGGWDIEQSVLWARQLHEAGVDLIDVSSGGNVATAKIPVGPGYQVHFAEQIRRDAGIPTAAVGLIDDHRQAEQIVSSGQADLVALARAELRDPYWPLHAAHTLGAEIQWPNQYVRAKN
ncbi:MAG: NADH:flavin oxidoreductase/NADH oxidase [Herpetosiphon sp.]